MNGAALAAEAAIQEVAKAGENAGAERINRAVDTIAEVSDNVQREMFQSRLATALRGVVRKSTILSEVNRRLGEHDAHQQQCSLNNREAGLRALQLDPPRLIDELEDFFLQRAHLPPGAALVLVYFTLNQSKEP